MIRSFSPARVLANVVAATSLVGSLLATGSACAQELRAQAVAHGLDHPWAVAFLPQGRFLVTERPGRMRVIDAQGKPGAPLADVPPVAAGGQGGLLDVVLDSGFEANRELYFCFSEPGPAGNSTALARARLSPDASRLEDVKGIFSQKPKVASSMHFGCRIVEARESDLDGTPPAQLATLAKAVRAAVENPALRERLLQQGVQLRFTPAPEFGKLVESEFRTWGKAVEQAKVKLQ